MGITVAGHEWPSLQWRSISQCRDRACSTRPLSFLHSAHGVHSVRVHDRKNIAYCSVRFVSFGMEAKLRIRTAPHRTASRTRDRHPGYPYASLKEGSSISNDGPLHLVHACQKKTIAFPALAHRHPGSCRRRSWTSSRRTSSLLRAIRRTRPRRIGNHCAGLRPNRSRLGVV